MTRSRRITGIAVAVAAAATAGGVSTAIAVNQSNAAAYTLKFGYVTNPAHPYGQTLTQFKNLVETNSGGQIAVQLIPGYGGASDIALLSDISTGAVDGGAVSSAVWPSANINSFVALQMPGLIDSYELESRVINNSSGIAQRMLRLGTQRAGLKGLAIFEGGMRQLVLKNQITSLKQLKGLKVRSVQSQPLEDGLAALGMSPEPLSLGDAIVALKQGTVDGLEANSALVSTQKFNTVGAKNIVIQNLWPFPTVAVMNQASFNKLPADLQKVVTQAAKDLPAFSISTLWDKTGSKQGFWAGKLCASGVTYQATTGSERKAFLKAEQPVYRKYMKNKQTATFVAAIQRIKATIKNTQPTDNPPASCVSTTLVGP